MAGTLHGRVVKKLSSCTIECLAAASRSEGAANRPSLGPRPYALGPSLCATQCVIATTGCQTIRFARGTRVASEVAMLLS
jgi:hypothetical protein